MSVRVAINGFGRIGRNILRALAESGRRDMEVVALNDLAPSRPMRTCCDSIPFTAVSPARSRFRATASTAAPGKSKSRLSRIPANCRGRNSGSTLRWNAPAFSPRRKKPQCICRRAPSACSSRRLRTAPISPSSTASITTS